MAGLSRASTSLRGRAMGSESYSSPVRNKLGAALRSSPKVILTAPKASCGKIFSREMAMLACDKSTPPSIHLERTSGGNFSKMGSNGISRSDILVLAIRAGRGDGGAGAIAGCGGGATGATGVESVCCGTAMVAGRTIWGSASSPLSTRRSNPRSKPANFILKLLANALMFSHAI